jgi:peptidyl-prolyl cis-trans isomerase C
MLSRHRVDLPLAVLVLCLAFLALPGCQKKDAGKPEILAQVGKETLSLDDLQELIPAEYRGALGLQEKESLVQSWVNTELIYQAAMKNGLNKEKDIARKLRAMERQMLANEMVQRKIMTKVQVTEEEAKKYYDAHAPEFAVDLRLRHILSPSEEQARMIRDSLNAGADFAALARQHSMDPAGQAGGDLGFMQRGVGTAPLEFEEAAFALKKGEISGVVRTNFGYHILQVTESHPLKQKATFDQIKGQLMNSLTARRQQEAFDQALESYKKDFAVVTHLDLLK